MRKINIKKHRLDGEASDYRLRLHLNICKHDTTIFIRTGHFSSKNKIFLVRFRDISVFVLTKTGNFRQNMIFS